jgi:hypothetical protein
LTLTARVEDLWRITEGRLSAMGAEDLADLAVNTRRPACLEEVVSRFESRKRYTTFASLRKVLRNDRVQSSWSSSHAERLVRALKANSALAEYMAFDSVTAEVLSIEGAVSSATQGDWTSVHEALVARGLHGTAERIRKVIPDIPAPASASDDEQGHLTG